MFLLVCVAGVPWLLARIPLAALAAMLIYTGFRLASPSEFAKTWRIGREQMVIFISTIIVTVATDLLLGVAAGILIKMILHWNNGMPVRNTFKPHVDISKQGEATVLKVGHAAVFSNYLTIKKHLNSLPATEGPVIIDLSATRIVDHTVMEKLHELEQEWAREGRSLLVTGLEAHECVSEHPLAARHKKPETLARAVLEVEPKFPPVAKF
jgi:MFS superfamily sulfate permease-like transporter